MYSFPIGVLLESFQMDTIKALDKAKELKVEAVTIFTSMIAGMTEEEITRYFLSQSISGLVIYGMSRRTGYCRGSSTVKDLPVWW